MATGIKLGNPEIIEIVRSAGYRIKTGHDCAGFNSRDGREPLPVWP
jgi:hypothetical protein